MGVVLLSPYAIEHYLALNPFLGLIKRRGDPSLSRLKTLRDKVVVLARTLI